MPFFDMAKSLKEIATQRQDPDLDDELPPQFAMIRRLLVTPTREIFLPSEPIVKNRIIRSYNPDNFLRVVLRDEDYERISAALPDSLDPIMTRLKLFLRQGFTVKDRKYEFLGCSNSQLREHGFWFCAPHDNVTAQSIRQKSGDLDQEKCVATFVSRFGLCFSSSRETVNVDVESGKVRYEPDIERNFHCFTDGIGKISVPIANQVSEKLELTSSPSAFQIRYGGCKGVVSQDPSLGDKETLVIRESMNKFTSPSTRLEILQTTNPGQLHMNRQAITLLSGLGVPDHIFMDLQEKMLFSLTDMMIYDNIALQNISQVSIDVKYKLLQRSGICFQREPFFRSILLNLYKSKISELMRRARIETPCDKGRSMMGTVDESGRLQYGQVFVSYTPLPRDQNLGPTVYTGKVVATKNSCFHPGDLRTFDAVDVVELHHMVDCIVFPQNGQRPHPDEMSTSCFIE